MKRRYHTGFVLIILSAMLALNFYKAPVLAASKKEQVENENKKLREENEKIQNEIKDLDEKMTQSHETYDRCRSKLSAVTKRTKRYERAAERGETIKGRAVKNHEQAY